MFSSGHKKAFTPIYFSKEWAEQSLSRSEVQYALQVIRDYINICTEHPPHSEVKQALDYLENKDSKTFRAVRNFRKCIYSPLETREQALKNMYDLIRRQFGE